MTEMSDTRLYLGNLPRQGSHYKILTPEALPTGNKDGTDFAYWRLLATKKDVEDFFNEHGHGSIQEIKLMNGFGFIEYSNPADARDIVPSEFYSWWWTR